MNTDLLNSFAQRLTHEPRLLAEAEDQTLRSLLLRHSTGLLDADTAKDADALIASDSRAAAIWAEYQATDEHLRTEAGKEWLSASRDRMLSHLAQSESTHASIMSSLQETPVASLQKSLSTFLQRIKNAFSLGDSSGVAAGYAFAQSAMTEEFMPHLEGQVVTRLWKNEAGKTMLWVMTENSDYASLDYHYIGGPSGTVLLKAEGGSFLAEIELDAGFVASGHPAITRAPL